VLRKLLQLPAIKIVQAAMMTRAAVKKEKALIQLKGINGMLHNYSFSVAERFMRYVKIDTQSNPHSNSFPSTEKQKILSNFTGKRINRNGHCRCFLQTNGDMCMQPFIPNTKKCSRYLFFAAI